MTCFRKLSILTVGCLLIMGGVAAYSQAEITEGHIQADAIPGMIVRYVQFVQVTDYIHALEMQKAVEYVQAVQAQEESDRQAIARLIASQQRPRPVPQPVPQQRSSGGGGGDCYAGPIPAYIVTRESGGNPTAMNPSGAYGCFQIMPYVWSANCSDLDRGVGGQIECANRISNGGTNLQPWSAKR